MAYPLSFTEDFYKTEDSEKVSSHPTSVYQALYSMPQAHWDHMIADLRINNCIDSVLELVKKTDTCEGYHSPVVVWIDKDDYWTVTVYEEKT